MAKDTSSSCTLVDKLNKKSQVWKHFGLVPDADKKPKGMDKPRCKLCFEEIIAKYRIARNVGGAKLWRITNHWEIKQKFKLPDASGGPGVKLWRIEVHQNIKTNCKTLQRIAAP